MKFCVLDPLPASLMRKCYTSLVPVLKAIINQSLALVSCMKSYKLYAPTSVEEGKNANFEDLANYGPNRTIKIMEPYLQIT